MIAAVLPNFYVSGKRFRRRGAEQDISQGKQICSSPLGNVVAVGRVDS